MEQGSSFREMADGCEEVDDDDENEVLMVDITCFGDLRLRLALLLELDGADLFRFIRIFGVVAAAAAEEDNDWEVVEEPHFLFAIMAVTAAAATLLVDVGEGEEWDNC